MRRAVVEQFELFLVPGDAFHPVVSIPDPEIAQGVLVHKRDVRARRCCRNVGECVIHEAALAGVEGTDAGIFILEQQIVPVDRAEIQPVRPCPVESEIPGAGVDVHTEEGRTGQHPHPVPDPDGGGIHIRGGRRGPDTVCRVEIAVVMDRFRSCAYPESAIVVAEDLGFCRWTFQARNKVQVLCLVETIETFGGLDEQDLVAGLGDFLDFAQPGSVAVVVAEAREAFIRAEPGIRADPDRPVVVVEKATDGGGRERLLIRGTSVVPGPRILSVERIQVVCRAQPDQVLGIHCNARHLVDREVARGILRHRQMADHRSGGEIVLRPGAGRK